MADGVLSMGRVVWAIGNWEVARAAETRSRGDVWVWNCVVWLRKRQRTGAVQDLSVLSIGVTDATPPGVQPAFAEVRMEGLRPTWERPGCMLF